MMPIGGRNHLVAIAGLATLALAAPVEAYAQEDVRSPACNSAETKRAPSRDEIETLLVVTASTGPLESLEKLRSANCLAQAANDTELMETIAARLALLDPRDVAIYEEAINCKRRGEMVEFTEEEKRRKREELQACITAFDQRYPQYHLIKKELLFSLMAVVPKDDEEKLWSETNRLDNLDRWVFHITPELSPADMDDYRKAQDLAEKYWKYALADAPESESDVRDGPKLSAAQFMAQMNEDLQAGRRTIDQIFALDPAAWVWALSVLDNVSADLMLLGSSELPNPESFLNDNVALWKGAAGRFAGGGLTAAKGIARLELAIAHRKLGNSESTIEQAREALENLPAFPQREQQVSALRVLAEELAYVGRPGDATAPLFYWLGLHGHEAALFRFRAPYVKQNFAFDEANKLSAHVHSALAAVLESEDRYGAAEGFRRKALEGYEIASSSAGSLKADRIRATYDLAYNLAAQGKMDEATELADLKMSGSSDYIGSSLEGIQRGKTASALAVLLDSPDRLERALRVAEEGNARLSLVADAQTRRNKALLLTARGDADQAASVLRGIIADLGKLGADDRDLSWMRAELARTLLRAGDTSGALKAARESLPEGVSAG